MEIPKRRFCRLECSEDPIARSVANSPPNLLASALERFGIPYELVVNRLELQDVPIDPGSCDMYPDGIGPLRVFVCEFLTTDPHLERARAIASETLSSPDSNSKSR